MDMAGAASVAHPTPRAKNRMSAEAVTHLDARFTNSILILCPGKVNVIWGALYGFVWWILGGLILMPALLGMSPFAPLMMAPMRPVAMGSLIGHLIYGLILGGVFPWLAPTQAAGARLPSLSS